MFMVQHRVLNHWFYGTTADILCRKRTLETSSVALMVCHIWSFHESLLLLCDAIAA